MKLSLIKQVIGSIATVTGDDNLEIRHLLTDSRQLGAEPEKTLFFALKTDRNDGAKYIPELQTKGVQAFVTGDALAALQALAAYVRSGTKLSLLAEHFGRTPDEVFDRLRELGIVKA